MSTIDEAKSQREHREYRRSLFESMRFQSPNSDLNTKGDEGQQQHYFSEEMHVLEDLVKEDHLKESRNTAKNNIFLV